MIEDYTTLHRAVFNWIRQGQLEFEGHASMCRYTDLDKFIFKLFDAPVTSDQNNLEEWMFNHMIMNGEINISWMNTDNALTLFKALVIRKELG